MLANNLAPILSDNKLTGVLMEYRTGGNADQLLKLAMELQELLLLRKRHQNPTAGVRRARKETAVR